MGKMIPDIDIHRAAWLMIRRYGEDAQLFAGMHERGRPPRPCQVSTFHDQLQCQCDKEDSRNG